MALESYNKKNEETIMKTLRELGGKQVTEQSGIRTHEKTYIAKPIPMSAAQHADVAVKAAKAEEEITSFPKMFNYRPWDGANAFQVALMRAFGSSGNGVATRGMFGSTPPQKVEIEIGYGETTQVPWGDVEFTLLDGTFSLGGINDPEFGSLFVITFTGPKKYEAEVHGIYKLIEDELVNNSIYKGKSFTGADMPKFLDPTSVDRDKVVYEKNVERSIIGLMWHPLRYTKVARERGVSLKRSILLGGPYGTGKSLAAMLTAQEANANGWTFIQCRPGKDNLDQVMKTAQLYQPSVVFYEDIDVVAANGDPETVQRLLESFDGISSKGTEMLVVLTTNHIDRIHKGMLRPGRMDGVIEIAGLDAAGCARLVLSHSADRLAGDKEAMLAEYVQSGWTLDDPENDGSDIDLAVVGEALTIFREPAFVTEVIRRVELFNLNKPHAKYTTQDFLDAAESLKFQWEVYNGAGEGTRTPTLDETFKSIMGEGLRSHQIDLEDGEIMKASN